MNNVGQKYVYYAPSQMENADKLRTLLGRFWHHDEENNQVRYGFKYNARTKKRIERTMKNYVDGLYERERALTGDLPIRDARIVRRRFRAAMLDGSLSEQLRQSGDMKFRLPANWFRIRRRYGTLSGYDAVTETYGTDEEGNTISQVRSRARNPTGTEIHEVYEIGLNPKFSENMKFKPVVVLGRRLGDDDKYEYRRYRKWVRVDNGGRSYGKKPTAREKYQSDLGRRGSRHFVIKHMFNRLQRHINSNMGEKFQDYYFEMTTPVDKILADKMNSGAGNIKVSNASQDCHYNYYLENYEKRLADNPDVLETQLPNPYIVNLIEQNWDEVFADQGRTGGQSSESWALRRMASCWHSIPLSKISIRVGKNDEQVIKAPRRLGSSRKKKRKSTNANSAYMEYLEEYSEHFPVLEQNYKDRMAKNQSNIVFGARDYGLLQDVCSKSSNIPLGAMINFTTQKTNADDLSKKMIDSGLTSIIMLKSIEHTLELQERAESRESYFARTMWTTEFPSMRVTEYQADRPAKMARVLPKNSKMMKSDGMVSFNLLDFLQMIAEAPHQKGRLATVDGLDDRVEEVSTIIHNGTELGAFQEGNDMRTLMRSKKMKTSLAAFILLGQLKKMAKETERSWLRLSKGSLGESRSEVVFYEIEKRRVLSNGESEVIQRFWVPNFEEQESIKFFDGQVKYDGTYKYTIHSWVAVFGTEYSYSGMAEDFDRDPNGRWTFGVYTDPFIKLMRMPYKTLEPIQIRDFPPVPPNVDIVPYRATSDKFIINFTAGVDDYLQKPEAILADDFNIFDKCYRSQYGVEGSRLLSMFSDKPDENTPLRFKSDDLPKFFQIFRSVEYAPTKWDDFSDSFSSQLNVEDDETSSIELVTPNTDYYYMFRSVDIHGNVSNPSPIYKVRINEGQGIFTEVEAYDFEKDKITNRSFSKSVTKTVQITPVFEQVVFRDDRQPESKKTIANQRKIRLGVAQDSIYGKKLKFRITSRKSGRKVDLNVSFTHTHKKPQRD